MRPTQYLFTFIIFENYVLLSFSGSLWLPWCQQTSEERLSVSCCCLVLRASCYSDMWWIRLKQSLCEWTKFKLLSAAYTANFSWHDSMWKHNGCSQTRSRVKHWCSCLNWWLITTVGGRKCMIRFDAYLMSLQVLSALMDLFFSFCWVGLCISAIISNKQFVCYNLWQMSMSTREVVTEETS